MLAWTGILDYIIQRRESKYDLHQQHCVRVQRFETYYKKNSISHRGSTVWNLLEPSAISTRDYAKRAKRAHALRDSNFKEESLQRAVPKLTVISYFINSIHTHIFYRTYFTFYRPHSILIIFRILSTFLFFFTWPYKLY